MNLNKIRQKLTGGFTPFVIYTSDGREYEVPHPEFILLGKFDIAVTDKDGDIAVLDPIHIVAVKNNKAKRNGKPIS